MATISSTKFKIESITGNSFGATNLGFKIIGTDTKKYPYASVMYFYMNGATSGCGLGVLGSWSSYVKKLKEDKELREIFIEKVKETCKTHSWFCVIATLGESWLGGAADGCCATKSDKTKKSNYEDFIEGMGFKEVDHFINLLHSKSHRQKIYIAKVRDLK